MTKSLSRIPADVTVMLDANIVTYALRPQSPYHLSCRKLLDRGAKGAVRLHMVVNSVSDVMHRSMVAEIVLWENVEPNKAVSYLKRNWQSVQTLTRYKTVLADLKQANINILPLTYRDLHNSRRYRDQFGLMSNDSLIVAVMDREKIRHLATNDRDFSRIPHLAIRTPTTS